MGRLVAGLPLLCRGPNKPNLWGKTSPPLKPGQQEVSFNDECGCGPKSRTTVMALELPDSRIRKAKRRHSRVDCRVNIWPSVMFLKL